MNNDMPIISSQNISSYEAERLVGKEAVFSLHPAVHGHIIAVTCRNAGRTYTFEWFDEEEGMLNSAELSAFQLMLVAEEDE